MFDNLKLFVKEEGKFLLIIFIALSATAFLSFENGKQIGAFQMCEKLGKVNAVDRTGTHICVDKLEITPDELYPTTKENIADRLVINNNFSSSPLFPAGGHS